jgi:ATPases involved in chromosome partitioning
MARIIAVANQKGGVGKTTTVLNLGAALHKEGQKVLLVDLDPQAALTVSLRVPVYRPPVTIYQVLLGQNTAASAVRATNAGARLIPADIDLAAADLELAAEIGRERILAEALAPVASQYDFILIDCAPSLGLLTLNALVAAGEVLIPLQCEYLAMRAMSLLLRTVDKVKAKLNPGLSLAGILVTMYNRRTVHAQEVLDEVRSTFGSKVFSVVITSAVRFKEAPASGLSILDYATEHEGADAYRALAKELLK